MQSWHFTVQHELAKDLVLDVGYVGTRGVGLMILGDYNQARPERSDREPQRCRRAVRFRTSASSRNRMGRRIPQLSRAPGQARKALQRAVLPAELLHLVEGDRQCLRTPGNRQRRQLPRELSATFAMRRDCPATTSRSTTRRRSLTNCRSARTRKFGSNWQSGARRASRADGV